MKASTAVQTFTNEDLGTVRTVEIEGVIWFVAIDVATILGYSNPRDAIKKHVDDEDKGVAKCDTLGGAQDLTIINESGLYSLILSSKMPKAKAFKRWVTSEVLPALRKHGAYIMPAGQSNTEPLDEERPTKETTAHEYLKIAQIVASCKADRLPMVLNILAKGGWEIATPQELMRNGLADTSDAGAKIQAAMDKHNMTYTELANAIGFERVTLYTWLIGKRYPKPKNYIKLINALEWLDKETNS